MRPSFLGFNIARSALMTTQQQLDVTGHNIANASVEGYSRQRLHLQAAIDVPTLGGYNYPGTVGQGVQADQLQRLRDEFLDKEYREKQEEQFYYQTQSQYLQRMETFLGELGESGMGASLQQFFDSWQELSLRPDDLAIRRIVVAAGNDLTFQLRNFIEDVTRIQNDTDDDLALTVDRINEISRQTAELNLEIAKRVNLQETPADLMDQRDRLLDELAQYVRFKRDDYPDGSLQISVDGKSIIYRNEYQDIEYQREPAQLRGIQPIGFPNTLNAGDLVINGVDILGSDPPVTVTTAADYGLLVNQINSKTDQTGVRAGLDPSGRLLLSSTSEGSGFIQIESTGVGLNLTGINTGNYTLTDNARLQLNNGTFINYPGGKVQSLLETKTQAIPETLDRIHQLTAELIRRVNDIHSQSFDLNGQSNRAYFTGTNPRDIEVAATIQANPALLAIAADASFPPGDGSQAIAISQLRFNGAVDDQSFEEYYRDLVTDMGLRINTAESRSENLERVLEQITIQRESIAGVNLDEELSNMLQFQRSFNAAARVMNTLDEMLNLIVNGLGS